MTLDMHLCSYGSCTQDGCPNNTEQSFMRGEHISVHSYPGVAFWFVDRCFDHRNCAIAVMVGDDYRHHVHIGDCRRISEDEFCGGCGQIGCGW